VSGGGFFVSRHANRSGKHITVGAPGCGRIFGVDEWIRVPCTSCNCRSAASNAQDLLSASPSGSMMTAAMKTGWPDRQRPSLPGTAKPACTGRPEPFEAELGSRGRKSALKPCPGPARPGAPSGRSRQRASLLGGPGAVPPACPPGSGFSGRLLGSSLGGSRGARQARGGRLLGPCHGGKRTSVATVPLPPNKAKTRPCRPDDRGQVYVKFIAEKTLSDGRRPNRYRHRPLAVFGAVLKCN